MRKLVLIVPLLALLGLALWFAAQAWTWLEGPDMPLGLYVAMGFGVFFSLVVGCGLMALVFYSARYGYDEPHREETQKDRS